MNNLQRLQQARHFVNDILKEIDIKIKDEKLTIALKDMVRNKELMKALKTNTGGR